MNCERAEALLHELLDGSIGGDERRSLDAHLASCAGCGEHLSELRSLEAALGALPEVEPPVEAMWQGLEARIESGAAEDRPSFLQWLELTVLPAWSNWKVFVPTLATAVVLLGIWLPGLQPWAGAPPVGVGGELGEFSNEAGRAAGLSMAADTMDDASRGALWQLAEDAFDEARSSSMESWEVDGVGSPDGAPPIDPGHGIPGAGDGF